MGAQDISFELNGDKTFAEVRLEFKRRQDQDRSENGHCGGYSGDFQTVSRVEDHGDKVFNKLSEAKDYCIDKARKWESVIAVKYKVIDKVPTDKKLDKLKTKAKDLCDKWQADRKAMELDASKRMVGSFVTCLDCKARMPVSFTTAGGVQDYLDKNCPVCRNSLARRGARAKVIRSYNAYQAKCNEIKAHEQELRQKAANKSSNTAWLVCGWGAS